VAGQPWNSGWRLPRPVLKFRLRGAVAWLCALSLENKAGKGRHCKPSAPAAVPSGLARTGAAVGSHGGLSKAELHVDYPAA